MGLTMDLEDTSWGKMLYWLVVYLPLWKIWVRQWGWDDISFPCAARESLLGLALWPGATLYRGCFSCSNQAEQCHPPQNRSLPGQQTQPEVAEWATLQRFAVQNLLPPVQWPSWGHGGRLCPLPFWKLHPPLALPAPRGLMLHGSIAPCTL